MKLTIKRLDPAAVVPTYAKHGDAGMDLYAIRDFTITSGHTEMVDIGIAMAVPKGYFGSVRERSGLAAKGIRLGGGVIDSGYRGEVKVILTNLNAWDYQGRAGDRVAQVIIQPIINPEIVESEDLSSTERGASGFGSTGA